ncbi:MAG: serine/threonine-protein kinase [Kofleriaceae bacterium]
MIGSELDGRYRVVAYLGAGGMGEVYLAEHIQLGRQEALKILRPELAWSPELVARLRREARAINRLHHPNIVSLYDFGRLPDGRYYLSMELADGEGLQSVLTREAPMAIPRVIEILLQLCEALEHAHDRGVIHRDLKPANLIVTEYRGNMVLKVLDFGLAKIVDPQLQESHHTPAGSIYGTPAYMAPERFLGPGHDARTDIYSLGCIAFEMLTGSVPFAGWLTALSNAHINHPPPKPSTIKPTSGITDDLDALVLHCLEKNPARRPQSARHVRAALNALIAKPERPKERRKSRTLNWLQMTIGDEATAVSGGHPGGAEPATAEDPGNERRSALRNAADVLLDGGCGDVRLVLAVAELDTLDRALLALIDELEELERQCAHSEQVAREQEASLRFSLGEMRLAKDRTSTVDDTIDEVIDNKIDLMTVSLAETLSRHESEMRRITDREVEIVAEIARREDVIQEAYHELAGVIARALHGFSGATRDVAAARFADAERLGEK